ncbi:MAG TPA: hypothetical protein DCG75_05115 [Bacteroidales bacterium]|nr:hypothetical protein [Bacteroidales bacterium]
MKKTYLIIFLIAITQSLLFAQDYSAKYNTRTIVLNYPDSVVKVKVLNTEEDFKIKDDLNYYWYNNNMIGYNKGGVNGKPLHGTYTVCNIEGALITQGEFLHGLKEGKWKSWYISGELKTIENYKNGLKDDIQCYYSESGEIVKETKYKNGVKLENKEGSFLKSIFNKKDKEEKVKNDSTEINNEIEK